MEPVGVFVVVSAICEAWHQLKPILVNLLAQLGAS